MDEWDYGVITTLLIFVLVYFCMQLHEYTLKKSKNVYFTGTDVDEEIIKQIAREKYGVEDWGKISENLCSAFGIYMGSNPCYDMAYNPKKFEDSSNRLKRKKIKYSKFRHKSEGAMVGVYFIERKNNV